MDRNPYRAMLAKRLAVMSVFFVGCLFRSANAWAANSPLDMIRSSTNQALTVLTNLSDRDKGQRQQQIERMWEIVLPRFDTEEIAQRALGVNWHTLTAEQRKELVRLFIQLVKKNYGSTLEHYTADAQFFFDHEHIEGDHAEVQTRILAPSQGKSFSVIYRLHREGEAWLIYDVVAENVSLVQNYRNQFSRILDKSSGAGLIDALKQKLAELEAT
jgi:phospholipid transport system substrate-binding protein